MSGSVLELRKLSFLYPDGRLALQNISFQLAAGESVALVGPNGAGKSTVLLHLNGILPWTVQNGQHHLLGNGRVNRDSLDVQVWVEGMPVVDPHLPQIRRRVGLLFQDPDDQLFCPTVLDDVTFGPRNLGYNRGGASEVARRSLRSVGLEGYADRLPHHLSFGERRRVCLAGILACDPVILALDEPTSNLDPRSRRQFMKILTELPATKIIATHDLEMVLELCSRVILLDEGIVIVDGLAREVLSNESLLVEHGLELPVSIRYSRLLP